MEDTNIFSINLRSIMITRTFKSHIFYAHEMLTSRICCAHECIKSSHQRQYNKFISVSCIYNCHPRHDELLHGKNNNLYTESKPSVLKKPSFTGYIFSDHKLYGQCSLETDIVYCRQGRPIDYNIFYHYSA